MAKTEAEQLLLKSDEAELALLCSPEWYVAARSSSPVTFVVTCLKGTDTSVAGVGPKLASMSTILGTVHKVARIQFLT